MQQRMCPRCGAALPDDAQWEPLDLVDGRAPAYRNRHARPGGKAGDRKCVVYSGHPMLIVLSSETRVMGARLSRGVATFDDVRPLPPPPAEKAEATMDKDSPDFRRAGTD